MPDENKQSRRLRILAIEPYYGGSHQYFIDHWKQYSRHEFTILTLPAYKWRWRMRHSAVYFASVVREAVWQGKKWDLLFCSDMLDLASFRGLVPELDGIPSVVYFHENQLTYPMQEESLRDYQCVFTNFTTALSADQVWFNSAYHMNEFINALPGFLKKMPDFQPLNEVETIRCKSLVLYPGVEPFPPRGNRPPGPLRILWCARWEFDKGPETFFQALGKLKKQNIDFSLDLLGEQFRNSPDIFTSAARAFARQIRHWGWVERADFCRILQETDIVVSTAIHEFFGLSIMEAVSAGNYPVLPRRLAYPELFTDTTEEASSHLFFNGSAQNLCEKIELLHQRLVQFGDVWHDSCIRSKQLAEPFYWSHTSQQMDERLFKLSF